MKQTEVIFPLTRQCLLHGWFDGLEVGAEAATRSFIAVCNTRMIASAFSYAFAAGKSFPYYIPGEGVFSDERFMERIQARGAQGSKEVGGDVKVRA